jgi:hypothetical protein
VSCYRFNETFSNRTLKICCVICSLFPLSVDTISTPENVAKTDNELGK